MKKDIPSYELCKKLKELGYKQDRGHELSFYWIKDSEGIWLTQKRVGVHLMSDSQAAPTIGDMMDVLPHYIEYKDTYGWLKITKSDKCYVFYEIIEDIIIKFDDKSPPNALAKMLIRVLEEGYLDLTGPKSNVK